MEDKNLDANQRIELIQQMIRGTRRRLSFGSSNLFLLWGIPAGRDRHRDLRPAENHRLPRLAMVVAASRGNRGRRDLVA